MASNSYNQPISTLFINFEFYFWLGLGSRKREDFYPTIPTLLKTREKNG